MAKVVYYAIPNHLRPCVSVSSLKDGAIGTPSGFRDRLYLTDIGEQCWSVAKERYAGPRLTLAWHRTYFPWKLRLHLNENDLKISLRGRKHGDSTWSSSIALAARVHGERERGTFEAFLRVFAAELGRSPDETPYWTDEIWAHFHKKTGLDRDALQRAWDELDER